MASIITGTDQRDVLKTLETGDTLQGFGGDDNLFALHENAVLEGGDGDDLYRLYKPDATIVETEDGGHDTIWAWKSIVLPNNVEDVLFRRVGGWHTIEGNALDNTITAGDGTQALAGHGGDDTLTGGGDADTFGYAPGDGNDVITDFTPGEDHLHIGGGAASLGALLAAATETADGTVLTLDTGETITLLGVDLSALSADDISLSAGTIDPPEGAILTFSAEFDTLDEVFDGSWETVPVNTHPQLDLESTGKREHTYVDSIDYLLEDGTTATFSPFSVEDGILSITAIRTPDSLADEIPEAWLSGSLTTFGTFSQTYGHYEISAKLPAGQALWPAFWLVAEDRDWPPELDIFDVVGDETTVLRAGGFTSVWGLVANSVNKVLVPDMSTDFHLYSMTWTPEKISFGFDGVIVHEFATPPDMHDPMVLIANLAIGGWNGLSDETTPEGAAFEIDYIRVYQLPGVEDLPRADDLSDFADLENGIIRGTDLYGDVVYRAASGVIEMSLAPGEAATLVGNELDNILTGNALDNTLNGRDGNDEIIAGAGDDYLIGEDGHDTLVGGPGDDHWAGGTGDDTYVFYRGDGSTSRTGDLIVEQSNEGANTLVFADLDPDDVRSALDGARWVFTVLDETGAASEYLAVKVIRAPDGHDVAATMATVTFADGTIWDAAQGLFLHLGPEDTESAGTAMNDTLLGSAGDNRLAGMDGDDSMDGGEGIDVLYGWNGNDTLTDSGTEGGDLLYGEAGNDTLTGGDGWDSLYGGNDDDTLFASRDGDALWGGNGDDSLRGSGNGADDMKGGKGDDRVIGGGNDDTLSGGDGDDFLSGGGGGDVLDGGAGRDTYFGGAGADVFQIRLDELDGDQVRDFDASEGDMVQILGLSDPAQVSLAIGSDSVTLTDTLTGEVAELRISGAQETDFVMILG